MLVNDTVLLITKDVNISDQHIRIKGEEIIFRYGQIKDDKLHGIGRKIVLQYSFKNDENGLI